MKNVSLRSLTAESFKVGCLGFGGPVGQIALMHRIFVEERGWIDEARYLHALNYCMLLPGPEAQQLAVYVGWVLRGVPGGLIAGALFVLPGAAVIFALAFLYAASADAPAVAALFYGVKAAVVAIVAEAMFRIGKRAVKTRADFFVAAAAFAALFIIGAPFPLVILAAGAFGALRAKPRSAAAPPPSATPTPPPQAGEENGVASPFFPRKRGKWPEGPKGARAEGGDDCQRGAQAFLAAFVWAGLWLAPLALSFFLLGPDHVVTRVGGLFAKLAVVTFGGAYAVLAYLQQQAVSAAHWLTAAEMIDGLGLAETTPGPLVLVNEFVGFLAGWNKGGFGLAAACAAMASWQTFAPSFLWIFAGAPFAESLRENARAVSALRAITAAVLGVVASLALWFAFHVVFARAATLETPWGHALSLPIVSSFDPLAAILALACGAALIRFRINMLLVIAIAAGTGFLRLAFR